MTGEHMMNDAMQARETDRPWDAADIYAVAGDLLEEEGKSAKASIARYWARECSTHPLQRGVCRNRRNELDGFILPHPR